MVCVIAFAQRRGRADHSAGVTPKYYNKLSFQPCPICKSTYQTLIRWR
jgi:hypothetical protein